MAQSHADDQPVSKEPHLHAWVWVAGVLLLVGVGVGVWYSPALVLSLLPMPEWPTVGGSEEAAPALTLQLDERFNTKPTAYGTPAPAPKEKPAPPVAQPLPPLAHAAVTTPAPAPAPAPAPVVKAQADPLPDFLKMWQDREQRRD